MKIAVGGIHTECSTYSSLVQTREDFKVTRGRDLLDQIEPQDGLPNDLDLRSLFHARSIPGGPVSPDCYAAFKAEFLLELTRELPVDGVLLIMHGAMHVEGVDDVEGDWISSIRNLVGDKVPIAVSYDLHGNVTQKIVDAIDIFCAYRTAPHIDVAQTHARALSELVQMISGGGQRMVAWAPIPVLLPGEKTSTADYPASGLYRLLSHEDQHSGVTDANLMVGYVWADTQRATAAGVVTGTDPITITRSAERIAASYWNARNEFSFGVPTFGLSEALDHVGSLATKPVVLADSGDNPTGGGIGDRTDVLSAWLATGRTGALFAGIADEPAARASEIAGLGGSIHVILGGSLGSACPRAPCQANVLAICGTSSDGTLEVALDIAGNTVLATQKRKPFHHLHEINKFGIEPKDFDLVVVKAGYLVPEIASLANPSVMALTDGAVSQDMANLENLKRPKPMFPFQRSFVFTPQARLSARVAPKGQAE